MKRSADDGPSSSLSSLFSDDSLLASQAAREQAQRRKTEDEASLRAAVQAEQQEVTRRLSLILRKKSATERSTEKAVKKFARHGVLILSRESEGTTSTLNVPAIAALCENVEETICSRLTQLNVRFRGFASMRKRDLYAILENERRSSFKFQEVSSRCLGRLDIKLSSDALLPHFGASPPWLSVVHGILGGESQCKLAYCGFISSFPGSLNQPFHGDGPHLFGTTIQLPPHAVNVFVPLHDVTAELGPTEFFPGSHRIATAVAVSQALSSFTSLQQTTSLEIMEKCRGVDQLPISPLLRVNVDTLLYDYRTVHRGTANTSSSTIRRILYLLYVKSWFNDNINFGSVSIFDTENAPAELELQTIANESDEGDCAGHTYL